MTRIQSVSSKWTKTKILLKHGNIRRYVPETRLFTRHRLKEMLGKYSVVYVKPTHGTAGQGVMRVSRTVSGRRTVYRYQLGFREKSGRNTDELYRSISRLTGKRSYIVQKGIPLLRYKQRPFDIRVMVQRVGNDLWVPTGYIGRVAHPRKIVTNFHSGGRPMKLEKLLSPYVKGGEREALIDGLNALGVGIARQLQSRFHGLREIGVDIGLDEQLKPWILEVNTRPDFHIFNQLRDKSMYRRILRIARRHGRLKDQAARSRRGRRARIRRINRPA